MRRCGSSSCNLLLLLLLLPGTQACSHLICACCQCCAVALVGQLPAVRGQLLHHALQLAATIAGVNLGQCSRQAGMQYDAQQKSDLSWQCDVSSS
jgi:hypothetical protein